jgi:hypothetical protein
VRQQFLPKEVDHPPVVLTSAVNQIQLKKQLKSVGIENFELRSTRNGTRIITRSMADF